MKSSVSDAASASIVLATGSGVGASLAAGSSITSALGGGSGASVILFSVSVVLVAYADVGAAVTTGFVVSFDDAAVVAAGTVAGFSVSDVLSPDSCCCLLLLLLFPMSLVVTIVPNEVLELLFLLNICHLLVHICASSLFFKVPLVASKEH